MRILILAAGLGTRLRPLTLQMPKPLVRVVDKTILEHQMDLAHTVPEAHIHINAHYMAESLLQAATAFGVEKVWVETPEILGTGGPLFRMNAEDPCDELLVMNSDCYCRFDLKSFLKLSRSSGAPCALLAVDNPAVNTISLKSGYMAESRIASDCVQKNERLFRDFLVFQAGIADDSFFGKRYSRFLETPLRAGNAAVCRCEPTGGFVD